MARYRTIAVGALLITGILVSPARSASDRDLEAIKLRFQNWVVAFNGKDSAGVCDLFAPDLIYTLPEVQQGTRQKLCVNLDQLFKKSNLRVHYDPPDIHEILVSGDVAVVRLMWTLTTEMNGARDTTTEEGIDIFRRQTDGRWSIARFIAFTTRQNQIPQ
jgi:uncharacterized protein (TIGR02246 family)